MPQTHAIAEPSTWICLTCGNSNFSKRDECMRCSTPKPFEKNPAALKTATVGGSGLFAPPGIDPAKDWQCTCGNWNFSRREKCHKCGAKKDVARGGGTKRPGEGGGYTEFDEADEERRKRRAIEERDLKAERKATKTKCEYCKRASCIC